MSIEKPSPLPRLQWLREPQQARSQDTLARLLDAAEALLEEMPWSQITVAALVARARSSVGAFYARFSDKDSLLQHLHVRRTGEALRTADQALARGLWTGVPVADIVRALVSFQVYDYVEHAGFHREIVRQISLDPLFRERSTQVAAHTTRLVADLLDDRRGEIAVEDPLGAADMIHRVLFAVLDQHVQFYDRPPAVRVLSPEDLIEELLRTLLGYLGVQQQDA